MIRLTIPIVLLGLVIVGCVPDELLLPKSSVRILNISETIAPIIKDQNQITFLSWDGNWKGTDCDTEIVLRAEGRVEMIEYGYAVQKYEGKYEILTSDDGQHSAVIFNFDDPRAYMQPLAVYKSEEDLLVIPLDGSNGLAMGNRSGGTVTGGDSFWPFRQRKAKTENSE